MSGFDELQVAVERGEREAVVSMVKDALDGGTDPADILNDGLIAAMQAVGEKMEEGDMFIPEVLRAAKTMQAGLEINRRRDKVKVMIGGAPVSRGYAEEIGADAYASDAGAAIKTAEGFKS